MVVYCLVSMNNSKPVVVFARYIKRSNVLGIEGIIDFSTKIKVALEKWKWFAMTMLGGKFMNERCL